MDYFYTTDIHGTSFSIEGDEAAHLSHVMRMKPGDEIRIVDGRGTAYDARIDALTKKSVNGTILATYVHHNESQREVTVAVGLLKNPSKFDFLIEKVTELGVREIMPITTARTISAHAKSDRWQKLALAAMKQSGRSFLPKVHELRTLADVLADPRTYDRKLIAHEQPDPAALRSGGFAAGSAIILIGPEGGFTAEEKSAAEKAGYQHWYLGERRLRTETAAIVAAAMALIESDPLA